MKTMIILIANILLYTSASAQGDWYELKLSKYDVLIKFPGRPTTYPNPNTNEPIYTYIDDGSSFLFQISGIGRSLQGEPDVFYMGDELVEGFLQGFNGELIKKSNIYYKGEKCVEFSFKRNDVYGKARGLVYKKYIVILVYFSDDYLASIFEKFANSLVLL